MPTLGQAVQNLQECAERYATAAEKKGNADERLARAQRRLRDAQKEWHASDGTNCAINEELRDAQEDQSDAVDEDVKADADWKAAGVAMAEAQAELVQAAVAATQR